VRTSEPAPTQRLEARRLELHELVAGRCRFEAGELGLGAQPAPEALPRRPATVDPLQSHDIGYSDRVLKTGRAQPLALLRMPRKPGGTLLGCLRVQRCDSPLALDVAPTLPCSLAGNAATDGRLNRSGRIVFPVSRRQTHGMTIKLRLVPSLCLGPSSIKVSARETLQPHRSGPERFPLLYFGTLPTTLLFLSSKRMRSLCIAQRGETNKFLCLPSSLPRLRAVDSTTAGGLNGGRCLNLGHNACMQLRLTADLSAVASSTLCLITALLSPVHSLHMLCRSLFIFTKGCVSCTPPGLIFTLPFVQRQLPHLAHAMCSEFHRHRPIVITSNYCLYADGAICDMILFLDCSVGSTTFVAVPPCPLRHRPSMSASDNSLNT
jgi:hypothetical protein